jgi:hypothetical protein
LSKQSDGHSAVTLVEQKEYVSPTARLIFDLHHRLRSVRVR